MKYRIIELSVLIIAVISVYAGLSYARQAAGGQTIQKGGLVADVRAKKIGDIVTILINENARASNNNATQTNKQNQLEATGDFGNSFLNNLSGGVSAQTQNQYRGSGQVSTSGTFTMQITASIIKVKEDGNFIIRGSREVETNGEKVVTVVEGVIRPGDISRDNTISSSKIADARIFHQGTGVATQAHRPGLFTRILNWIF